MLRKCVGDTTRIITVDDVQVTEKLVYEEVSTAILDSEKMEIEKDVNVSTGTETVAAMTVASSSRSTTAYVMRPVEKPGKFSGINFKGWQQIMFFWLTTLGMQKFTNEDPPVPEEGMPENQRFMVIEAWKHSDFLCKGYILSALEDDLYNVYSSAKTSKELWIVLEKKYKTEDACLKKFVVAKFLDYKMMDSKTVGTQWRDFKNYLKHKHQEMTLENLVIRLKNEEDNKVAEKKSRGNSAIIGANIIEEAAPNNKKKKKPSRQKKEQNKKKFKGPKKNKKKDQENVVGKNDEIDDLCAMLTECNLVGNPKVWWIDSGATRHVCTIKEAFATYAPTGPAEELSMGNAATTKVEGYEKIFMKMTFGKVLTLNNILLVPTITKNLVSTSLLVKNGFKCVFVSDKAVVSKNDMYVGKGYLTECLFKLNVMIVDNINKISASSYLLESNDL
ncbi:uncharacterized protein LOC132601435 [Lycium barbarum]|uniref:uncharacterized protein LOC132601435 n=1 Tax=Lycium barbarum TaxID=112863 RepID=UPI00293F7112|nr:uncharacterized protein LOC132601435 [Lycium barbarum]